MPDNNNEKIKFTLQFLVAILAIVVVFVERDFVPKSYKCILWAIIITGFVLVVVLSIKLLWNWGRESPKKKESDGIPAPRKKGALLPFPPERPDNFVERCYEYNLLKKNLLGKEDEAVDTRRYIGIYGMGGIGKTVLASEVARDEEVRAAFPDGVIWLTFGRQMKGKITEQQSKLAEALDHRQIWRFEDWEEGQWRLSIITSKLKTLVILDDVWEVKHAQAFTGLGEGCRVLITTRTQEVLQSIGAREIPLSVLEEQDALQLLADSIGGEGKSLLGLDKKIVKECGYLPLAITVVGRLIGDEILSRKSALDRLEHPDLEVLKSLAVQFPIERPEFKDGGLLAVLEISVEELPQQARDAFLDCAVFPEDVSIPEAALATLWSLRLESNEQVRKTVQLLVRRSLIRRENKHLYRIHDLYHDYLIAKFKNLTRAKDLTALHRRLLDAYCRPDGWANGPNDGYFFQRLPYHLAQAGEYQILKKLLLDFKWLLAKLHATEDVHSIIGDYDNLAEKDEDLVLVASSLQLSAHTLASFPDQLSGQLIGRLNKINRPAIQSFLEQAQGGSGRTWLCPQTTSLMPPGGPLLRTLFGHTDSVQAIALYREGRRVISGSLDTNVCIWDLETGKLLQTLEGHASGVKAVAVTPDGRRAVSVDFNGICYVWDLRDGSGMSFKLHQFSWRRMYRFDHDWSIDITPDGQFAGVASSGGCQIWNLDSKKCLFARKLVWFWHRKKWSFKPIVKFVPHAPRLVTTAGDRNCWIWDVENRTRPRKLKGHSEAVRALAVTSNGKRVISASWDETFRVWDSSTGHELVKHRIPYDMWGMEILPDSMQLIYSSYEGIGRIINPQSGATLGTLEGHTDSINAIAGTPDGSCVVSASDDWTLKIWDLEASKTPPEFEHHNGKVIALRKTSDGKRIVTASEDKVFKIWEVDSGALLRTVRTAEEYDTGTTRIADVSSDGHYGFVSGRYGICNVWNLTQSQSSPQTINLLDQGLDYPSLVYFVHLFIVIVVCASIFVFLKDILIVSALSFILFITRLSLWRTDTYDNSEVTFALVPNHPYVIIGSRKKLWLWNWQKGKLLRRLKGWAGSVTSIRVAPSGRYAISKGGLFSRKWQVWDLERGKLVHTLHTGRLFSWASTIALTPDGQYAISGDSEGELQVWKINSGSRIARVNSLNGHKKQITSIAIGSDSKTLVSASEDTTVKVWEWSFDAQTVHLYHTLKGHATTVKTVIVTPDCLYAASGSIDGNLRLWSLQTGECIAAFHVEGSINVLDCVGNDLLVAGSANGSVHILRLIE